ncbi:flagellar hook-length control protein FliK [Criibacterium bergeronii]|uniref:Flagellar hook-length control protein FliK n=1 Tax=Criibacterium bergeronii TaxID=1871336 RepID=A0A371INS0_9FIRM|nr:flagellar hook-length control protein FliK [Criibacterium bergeronii]MBS6062390.1 flagellar hook-length control protein FliK [Peptostreptococcaceae bacterium]RDY22141.1 flagellar hook-length control protein FliK [Criibacterium bergeronii]
MEKISQTPSDKLSNQSIVLDLTKNLKLSPQDTSVGNFKDYINNRQVSDRFKTKSNGIESQKTFKPRAEKLNDTEKISDGKTQKTDTVKNNEKKDLQDVKDAQKTQDVNKSDSKKMNQDDNNKIDTNKIDDKTEVKPQDNKVAEDNTDKEVSQEVAAVLNTVNLIANAQENQATLEDVKEELSNLNKEDIQDITEKLNLSSDVKQALNKLVDLMNKGQVSQDTKLTTVLDQNVLKQFALLQNDIAKNLDKMDLSSRLIEENLQVLDEPEQAPMDFAKELQSLKNDSMNNNLQNFSNQFDGQNILEEINNLNQTTDIDTVQGNVADIKTFIFGDKAIAQAKMISPNMTQQIENFSKVVDEIRVAFFSNKTSLNIKLEPESLGKLSVKINSENGIFNASFFVESEKAKQILENQMITLRQALTDQGITVQDINVQVGQNNEDLSFHKNLMEARNYSGKIGTISKDEDESFNPYIKDDDSFNDLI